MPCCHPAATSLGSSLSDKEPGDDDGADGPRGSRKPRRLLPLLMPVALRVIGCRADAMGTLGAGRAALPLVGGWDGLLLTGCSSEGPCPLGLCAAKGRPCGFGADGSP